MSLAQPWWLLLGLLVGLLVYLHRQRRAARAVEVGNLHLWRRVAVQHSPQANPPARWSAALLLQLLVLLLVALALARPSVGPREVRGGTLLLLESSRAMQATDTPPSRFAAAVNEGASQLSAPVTVIQVGEFPVPLAVNRTDIGAVRARLRAVQAGDGVANWPQAARLASSLLAGVQGVRVVAYASPSGAQAARTALQALDPQVRVLGGSLDNAAITALSVTPAAEGQPWALTGAVRAYGVTGQRTVTVSLNDRPLKTWPLTLKDGQDVPFSLKFTPGEGGVLQAALDTADALPADDTAQLRLSPQPQPLKVAVLGPDGTVNPDDPLERGLRALPGVQIERVSALPAQELGTDLLVVTRPGVTPPTSPAAPVTLWLNADARQGQADAPLAWQGTDALSRGVGWANVRVTRRAPVQAWPEATALLSGQGGPLVEVRRQIGGTDIRVNFALQDSNWASLPAWPVFLSNLAELAQPRAGQRVSACTMGLPCALPARTATLKGPGLNVDRPGLSFTPLRAGVYEVNGQALAVNRFAGPEADLRVPGSQESAQLTAAPVWNGWAWLERLWRPLLALALVALLLELLLAVRAEPQLRRGGWRAAPLALRRMLALHALAALLMLLAVLNVPLPGPGRERAEAALLPPDAPAPPGAAAVSVWGGPQPSLRVLKDGPAGDLGLSLLAAAAALPDTAARTVTVSGAVWPASSLLPDVLAQLRAQGVQVNVRTASAQQPLAVQAFDLPGHASAGQTFAGQVVVFAPQAGAARLELRRADQPLIGQDIQLRQGFNRLALPLREEQAGVAGYTLTVRTANQTVTAAAATRVRGQDGVLLVSTDTAAQDAVARALRVQGVNSRRVTPDTLNAAVLAPEGLKGVQRLALLDVPARALSADTRFALQDFVQGGGHLFLGGGANTFGPGGYVGTTLETLSPLSGRITRDVPRLGLALVLDKSGSMNEVVGNGYTKLDLIKSAALNSALLLNPESDVAVIAFDSSPKVAVPLTRASQREQIRTQISRIEAEGGTVVKRALEAALKELSGSTAGQRHIILLTDGIDGGIFSPEEYHRLIRRIHATGITVSTVSVGSGMHIPLIRSIAEWGGGRFSITQDWRDVPALLAQDTLDQGPSAVKTGAFGVRWGRAGGTVQAYVQTTLKPGATLLASVGQGSEVDPLAATWRVGLGSVSALATQTAGAWATGFAGLPGYPALLSPLLRGELTASDQPVTLTRDGADLIVKATQAQVNLGSPDGTQVLNLIPDGTGHFTGRVLAPVAGGYSVQQESDVAAAGVPSPTPQPEVLRQVAQATGGSLNGDAANGPAAGWSWRDGWPVLALLSLLSFLTGLAWRYLPGLTRTDQRGTAGPGRAPSAV